MACDLSGKKAYRLPGPSKSEESDLSLIISCLSRLVFFSLLSIYPSTMKFSLIAASLLVGSASAWSSMTMKAGKLFLFVLLGYQKSIVHIYAFVKVLLFATRPPLPSLYLGLL